jgi:hypothetical protein
MKVHIDVVLPDEVANSLAAACLKFGLDRDLFVERAIEEKLAHMADDGANWKDGARERNAYLLRKPAGDGEEE